VLRRTAMTPTSFERVIVANADQLVIVSALVIQNPRSVSSTGASLRASLWPRATALLDQSDLASPDETLERTRLSPFRPSFTYRGGPLDELFDGCGARCRC